MLPALRAQLEESRRAFAAVFRNPNLRRVLVSWAGTVCTYWIFIVALGLYAYERGGAGAVGLVGLLRVLPSVVAAPFGAVLGDRYRRERVVVAINVARSVTIAGAALAAFAGAPAGVVYALASVMGLLQSVFRPTQSALLPLLASTPEELTASNLALTTVEAVGVFAGPAIGGLLVAVTGVDTVFAVTAGGFLVAAVLLLRVGVERETVVPSARRGFVHEALAGFGTVVHDAKLRLIIALYGTQTLLAGAVNVLIVVMALETLDLGKAGIGFLSAAVGVGGLLGGFAAFALVGRAQLASAFGVGLVLSAVPVAAIALLPQAATALILLGLMGLGTTIVDVAGVTLLQRNAPDVVLTRVMGVVQSVFVGTLGLGAVIVPLLIHLFGNRWTLAATGGPVAVVALLFWPQLRRLDAATAAAPANAALLRATPIFAPLPPPVVEQLAREARPLSVAAGAEVVRQGDAGDTFFVIVDGEASVRVDGREGATLHPGESFGEIALLRDVPRTATIVARTPLELLAIERETFLAAVTGNPESAEAAHAVVAARLGSLRPEIASV